MLQSEEHFVNYCRYALALGALLSAERECVLRPPQDLRAAKRDQGPGARGDGHPRLHHTGAV